VGVVKLVNRAVEEGTHDDWTYGRGVVAKKLNRRGKVLAKAAMFSFKRRAMARWGWVCKLRTKTDMNGRTVAFFSPRKTFGFGTLKTLLTETSSTQFKIRWMKLYSAIE
jgi:hypothetical protein